MSEEGMGGREKGGKREGGRGRECMCMRERCNVHVHVLYSILSIQHWFLDGEVICFRDPGHIVLGLIAIFILLLLVLLIPVVFVFTIVGKSPKLRVIIINFLFLFPYCLFSRPPPLFSFLPRPSLSVLSVLPFSLFLSLFALSHLHCNS